jgi:uncharacterized protein YfaS (alpha-2-macroglobulin family)
MSSKTELPKPSHGPKLPRFKLPHFRLPGFVSRAWEKFKRLDRRQRTIIAIALVGVLLVVGSIVFLPRRNDGFSRLLIDAAHAQDNFEVKATLSDSIGVDSATAFDLTSKSKVDEGNLRASIKLLPETSYDLKKKSDNEFQIIPKSALADKQVYKIQIASAYVDGAGAKQERDYSWAFQVNDQFKVYQTLPGNETTAVPLNTGIDITFSQDNFTDYEKAVTITPSVTGKFEKHGRTLSFVPDALVAGTLYTVTVSKNLPLAGSDKRLSADYTFRFETDTSGSVRGEYHGFSFEQAFSEFSSAQQPVFGIYQYGQTVTSVPVEVYAFKDESQFVDALKAQSAVPTWASYSRDTYLQDVKDLSKVASVKLPLSQYTYQQFFTLPDKLPRGYYLVRMQSGDLVRQAYFQVTDLSVYISATQTDTLVWVNDLATKTPAVGAKIEVVDSDGSVATSEGGVATFPTQKYFANQKGEYQDAYLRISKDGFSHIAPLSLAADGTYSSANADDDYWHYFYNDRSIYKPTDTINYWGFVQPRDTATADVEMTVRLSMNDYLDYFYDPIVVSEQKVQLANGALSGKLPIQNLTPGSYYLDFMLGDKKIGTRFISVQSYVKPAYDIQVVPERANIWAGEEAVFNVRAQFFEGTPVAGLTLHYTGNASTLSGDVTTDGSGMAQIRVPSTYQDCNGNNGCYPQPIDISLFPSEAETGETLGTATVNVFGADVHASVDFTSNDNKGKITAKVQRIDLDKVNQGADYMAGEVVPGIALSAEITEISYQAVEVGTRYDFINKVVSKEYRYDEVRKLLSRYAGVTDDKGTQTYEFTMQPDRSYELRLAAKDDKGRTDLVDQYLYSFNGYGSRYDNYFLRFKDKDKQSSGVFSAGEQVAMEFMNNEKLVPATTEKNFLYMQDRKGLLAYELSDRAEYDFNFDEKFVPNLYVNGVWFDGSTYHNGSTLVRFAQTDRALTVNLTTDKAQYKPGETVTLKAEVKDSKGNPMETNLNLNLVDEAFYALGGGDEADALGGLYSATVSSGELAAYISHETPADMTGAERGGCFVAGTKIKMADGTEKNIEQVKTGDTVLTFENEYLRRLVSAPVTATFQHRVQHYLVINGTLKVTPEHRVFINNGWETIGSAKVGDFMADEHGRRVRINSILSRQELVEVYNLSVGGYHTYIADGIYVHNGKDGGREDFVDTALFSSVRTDAAGQAQVTFTLPDNLTSWRVTAQGISNTLYAGSDTAQIKVSLPAFVTESFASEYLSSDKPTIKLNAYGTALKSGDAVTYELDAPTLGVNGWSTPGKAFEAQYIPLKDLTVGEHKITAGIQAGQYQDRMTLPINVVASRLSQQDQKFYTVAAGVKISGAQQGNTKVIFTDKERGQFLEKLSELGWTYGDRVDQKLSRVLSASLQQKYFDEAVPAEEFNSAVYQLANGGIALLPYGDADLELSAQIASVAGERFDTDALKNYFYGIYSDKNSNSEQVGQALFGLASLGEPVLVPLQHFAAQDGLSPLTQIYAALALYKLGDTETARGTYLGFLSKYAEHLDPYIRLKVGDNADENLKMTALSAVLAGGIGDAYRDNLWQYVAENRGTDILTNMEELMYINETLPKLHAGKASFTYTAGSKKGSMTLENGSVEKILLSPEELQSLVFANVSGTVGAVSVYDRPVTALQNSQYVSLKRKYLVNGHETTSVKENDLVDVVLTPTIGSDAPGDEYELTDLLPSGLKLVTRLYDPSYADAHCMSYPFEVNGQKVKFYVSKTWPNDASCGKELHYFVRVFTLGEYTAQPASIQSLKAPSVISYSSAEKFTITR